MHLEILAELQPPVSVRDGQRPLDVVGDGLASRVRQIVERQEKHMVAHADAIILTPVAHEPIELAGGRAPRDRGLEGGRLDLSAFDRRRACDAPW